MSKIGTSHKIDEAELIAYHLRELSPLRQRAVRRALSPARAVASRPISAVVLAKETR